MHMRGVHVLGPDDTKSLTVRKTLPESKQRRAPESGAPAGMPLFLSQSARTRTSPQLEAAMEEIPPFPHCPAERLPHYEAIQRSFGPVHDLSQVRAHVGGPAARASDELTANAFTVGSDIAFKSAPSVWLAAHEATHVIQQRSGAYLPAAMGREGDGYERQADAVASRAAAGLPAGELLPTRRSGNDVSGVQRQAAATQTPAPPSPVQAVRDALAAFPPGAGAGSRSPGAGGGAGFMAAIRTLDGLSMAGMLEALADLERTHELDTLMSYFNTVVDINRARLIAAMRTVQMASGAPADISIDDLDQWGHAIGTLSPDEQAEIVAYLAGVSGPVDVREIAREATQAIPGVPKTGLSGEMPEPTETFGMGPSAAMAAGMAPFGPGMFNPGGMPVSFYLGNTAHTAIGTQYMTAHPADRVFANFFPITSILNQSGLPVPLVIAGTMLAGKPDIANMTLLHLYEIKPWTALAAAVAEAQWYVETFRLAGAPMALGPAGAPGTSGVFYDAGFYYRFWSPVPGAILYQFTRRLPEEEPAEVPETVPVTVPAPQKRTVWEPETSPSWDLRLPPREIAVATGLTAGGLLLLMILLAPVGA